MRRGAVALGVDPSHDWPALEVEMAGLEGDFFVDGREPASANVEDGAPEMRPPVVKRHLVVVDEVAREAAVPRLPRPGGAERVLLSLIHI